MAPEDPLVLGSKPSRTWTPDPDPGPGPGFAPDDPEPEADPDPDPGPRPPLCKKNDLPDGFGAYDDISRNAMLSELCGLPRANAALPCVRSFYEQPSTYVHRRSTGSLPGQASGGRRTGGSLASLVRAGSFALCPGRFAPQRAIFFSTRFFFCPPHGHDSRPLFGYYGGAARNSPSGGSPPSPASQKSTGNSSKLCACARNAASDARAVQRRVSAAPAATLAHGARSRGRARASLRSSANTWLSKRPPTSSPKTTNRQRPCPPGWSSG